MLGGSDAGAHVDLMCHANYPTVVLGELVRERGLFTLEDAVRAHDRASRADLFGLRDRGRIAEGAHADLVVFDPDTVGSRPAVERHDLPGGALRLYAEAVGIEQVVVGGGGRSSSGVCSPAPSPVRCCDPVSTPTPSPFPGSR